MLLVPAFHRKAGGMFSQKFAGWSYNIWGRSHFLKHGTDTL